MKFRVGLTHLVLIGLGVTFLLPFYWLVSTALKPDAQIFAVPPVWIPHPIAWENFPKALHTVPIFLFFWNTLKICFFNVAGTVLATTNVTPSVSNWNALGTAAEISSGQFQFADPQATNYPRRFYRIRSP